MTISTDTATASYTGNGVTQIFPVPFYFLVDTDLKVSKKVAATGVVSVLVLNSDYTVSDAGNQAGGSITMLSVPASGDQIFIERNVDAVQETAYPENGIFLAASHEKALDRLTMLGQQILTALGFKLGRGALGDVYDAGGKRISNVSAAVDQNDLPPLVQVQGLIVAGAAPALNGANGSALVGFTQAGAGAVVRTVQDKMRERVSALDYCAGDGATDDAAQFQACLDDNAGKWIDVPAGVTIAIGSQVDVPTGTRLRIDGTLVLLPGSNTHMVSIPPGESDIVIEGRGTLDGNRDNQSSGHLAGIYAVPNNVHGVTISGLTITNVRNWPVNLVTCYDVIVQDCTFSHSGSSPEFAARAYNCLFQNCTAHHIDDYGLAFYGGVYNSGAYGCSSHDNSAGGIVVLTDAAQTDANHDILISGCTAFNNRSGGIEALNLGNGTVRNYCITIAGNICHHNGQSNSGVGDIRVSYCNYAIVADNNCHESGNGNLGAWGIKLQQISNCTVTGNVICNEGQGSALGQGISLDATVSQAVVANNSLTDGQSPPTTAYHINGPSGPNCFVHHNFIGNSIGAGINISSYGAGTRVQDNAGWNPVGALAAQTVPTSGTPFANPFPYSCKVCISGGTVTNIGFRVGSGSVINTGLTGGSFTLAPGESIVITYSAAPSWKWYGL